MSKVPFKSILILGLSLLAFNFIFLPYMRNMASSIDQQAIAKIPYLKYDNLLFHGELLIFQKGNRLTAYSKTETDKRLWACKIDSMRFAPAIAVGQDAIFALDQDYVVHVIDVRTGKELQKHSLPAYQLHLVKIDVSGPYAMVRYQHEGDDSHFLIDVKNNRHEELTTIESIATDYLLETYTDRGTKWSQFTYFKALKLFWDEKEQRILTLEDLGDYVPEISAFIVTKINKWLMIKVFEKEATFDEQLVDISTEYTFDHFAGDHLFFVGPGTLYANDRSVYFIAYEEGKLGIPYLKDGDRIPFRLKGGCIYLGYSTQVSLFEPKNYFYDTSLKRYRASGPEKQIILKEGSLLENFLIDDSNIYIVSSERASFKDIEGEQAFFYILPLDYAHQ